MTSPKRRCVKHMRKHLIWMLALGAAISVAGVAWATDGTGTDFSALKQSLSPTKQSPTKTHQIAGNPVRFQSGTLALRSDEAWRMKLSLTDRRAVTALTAPLMRLYGYPLRTAAQPTGETSA